MTDDIKLDLLGGQHTKTNFTEDYKDAVFYTWYSRGKCTQKKLMGFIDADIDGRRPSESVIRKWIRDDFIERAEKLDEIVKTEVENKVVTEKIQMLQRHAETGVEMQNMAIEYLREHKNDLRANNAVRLLVDGIRVERESRGLPTLITETINSTDEDLYNAIEKLIGAVDQVEIDDTD